MSKQVPWNKIIVERFVEVALLTKEEEVVLRTRVAGWTRTQQAEKLGISLSTLDRIIKRLKSKYDQVQKVDPILPPRKTSEAERYLDEN